jgi:hypothetical protein
MRQANVHEHMRRRHGEHCNIPELDRKRKVEADENERFKEIKRLRQETIELRGQFITLNIRSLGMMALIQLRERI